MDKRIIDMSLAELSYQVSNLMELFSQPFNDHSFEIFLNAYLFAEDESRDAFHSSIGSEIKSWPIPIIGEEKPQVLELAFA